MAAAAAKRARAAGGSIQDRLSALPNELLRSVLSHLPAQQAVRTTALSRRWKDLWRSMPGINLDMRDFRRADEGWTEGWTEAWERMEDFANHLLILHNGRCRDAFRLVAFVGPDSSRQIDRWIRRAVKDDPLVLEIWVLYEIYDIEDPPDPSRYQLPHLGFPAGCGLKRLKLTSVYLDDSFTQRLRSWCPNLEDLVLGQCSIGFSRIESDKLKDLVVQYCTNEPAAADLVIRAPRLTSLRLDIRFNIYENGVSLDVRNSLEKAFISIGPGRFSPRSEAGLIDSLCGVISLELKGFQTMAMLDKEFDKVSIFGNMRTLSLNSCFYNPSNCDLHKFKAVMKFLQKAPNLEKLTLKKFQVSQEVEPVEYPMLENLRTLFLNKCDLHDNFGILRHCLRNSPNLEKLTVRLCKLSDGSTQGEGNAKSKKTYSRVSDSTHFKCPKLSATEIMCSEDDANIPELVRFLLDICAPKNTITFTRF